MLKEHHDNTDGPYSECGEGDLRVICICALAKRGVNCIAHPPKKVEITGSDDSAVKGGGDVGDIDDKEDADTEATQLENTLYVLMTAKPKAHPSSSSDGKGLPDDLGLPMATGEEINLAELGDADTPPEHVDELFGPGSGDEDSVEVEQVYSKKPRLSDDLISHGDTDSCAMSDTEVEAILDNCFSGKQEEERCSAGEASAAAADSITLGAEEAPSEYDPIEEASQISDPVEEFSSEEETRSEMAYRQGMIFCPRSNKIHICKDEFPLKTMCGIEADDTHEMKYEASEHDIRCGQCFRLPGAQLPGRQFIAY